MCYLLPLYYELFTFICIKFHRREFCNHDTNFVPSFRTDNGRGKCFYLSEERKHTLRDEITTTVLRIVGRLIVITIIRDEESSKSFVFTGHL